MAQRQRISYRDSAQRKSRCFFFESNQSIVVNHNGNVNMLLLYPTKVRCQDEVIAARWILLLIILIYCDSESVSLLSPFCQRYVTLYKRNACNHDRNIDVLYHRLDILQAQSPCSCLKVVSRYRGIVGQLQRFSEN